MQVRRLSNSYSAAELNMKFWCCTYQTWLVGAASSPSKGPEISASFSIVVIVLKVAVFRTLI